jgi:catechol 2,3-dioxygenase-like lactoylglutathione lyase family enzyme
MAMITAIHLLIYSDDAEATRSFLRDVLGWHYVEEPDAPGWLIFKSGPSETGAHPTHQTHEGVTYDNPRQHSISLMCDDLSRTMAELESKGAEFTGPVEEQQFGVTVMLKVPGADDIMLYEPRHPTAFNLTG